MKPFILKLTLYVLLIAAAHAYAAVSIDGHADPYYRRICAPAQRSLIVGTSRAAQGIDPDVINACLSEKFAPIFNFGFTVEHSPYGKTYYDKIVEKLDNTEGAPGLFLVCVDIWSLSSDERRETPREDSQFLGRATPVSGEPNVSYLLNEYSSAWGSHLLNIFRHKNWLLHSNGRLEITANITKKAADKSRQAKLAEYGELATRYKFDTKRVEYLKETISLFQQLGSVFVVDLPVHPEFEQLEDELKPDFAATMEAICNECGVEFIDLSTLNDSFSYTDGSHLHRDSVSTVSETIAQEIDARRMADSSEQ